MGVREIPGSGDIAILAPRFEVFPHDAADCIIDATTLMQGATQIFADLKILA